MGFKYLTNCGIYLATLVLPFVIGQTLTGETLKQESFCQTDNVTLSCGSNSIIALENVRLGYNRSCSTQCCSFSVHDCHASLSDTESVKRSCSGHPICFLNLASNAAVEFCSFGRQTASYLYFEYFCISQSRVTSVCSGSTVDSPSGEPLYVTNHGFPGVTTGDASCSCSFEAESCSSSTTSFIIEADLYLDAINCIQQIIFMDSNRSSLGNVGCESFYNNYITQKQFENNYIQIDFINNSTQNREGVFIIGFQATEPNVTLRISCPTTQPTWCIDCGIPDQPTNGAVILDAPRDTGYSATASVTCNSGFNASATTITCKERGIWEEAICTIIDCGTPAVAYGIVELNSDTSSGATANVTCYPRFQTDTPVITCRPTGLWDNATCSQIVSCLTEEWQCDNGECIKYYERCDNFPDCIDVSDEKNCHGDTCSEGHILCKNSTVSYCSLSICDCGQPMHPVNGMVTLNNKTHTNARATANISCDSGFETTKATIWCQTVGLWDTSLCVPVDCGYPTTIENGYITLQRTNATTYGSSANVWCTTNYQSIRKTILCLASGEWEAARCIIIDEKEKDDPVITGIIGAVSGIAATVVVGAMVFLLQKIYRKRKESTKRTVASPDTSNADAVRNYEQLQPVTRIDESDHYHELASVTGTGRF